MKTIHFTLFFILGFFHLADQLETQFQEQLSLLNPLFSKFLFSKNISNQSVSEMEKEICKILGLKYPSINSWVTFHINPINYQINQNLIFENKEQQIFHFVQQFITLTKNIDLEIDRTSHPFNNLSFILNSKIALLKTIENVFISYVYFQKLKQRNQIFKDQIYHGDIINLNKENFIKEILNVIILRIDPFIKTINTYELKIIEAEKGLKNPEPNFLTRFFNWFKKIFSSKKKTKPVSSNPKKTLKTKDSNMTSDFLNSLKNLELKYNKEIIEFSQNLESLILFWNNPVLSLEILFKSYIFQARSQFKFNNSKLTVALFPYLNYMKELSRASDPNCKTNFPKLYPGFYNSLLTLTDSLNLDLINYKKIGSQKSNQGSFFELEVISQVLRMIVYYDHKLAVQMLKRFYSDFSLSEKSKKINKFENSRLLESFLFNSKFTRISLEKNMLLHEILLNLPENEDLLDKTILPTLLKTNLGDNKSYFPLFLRLSQYTFIITLNPFGTTTRAKFYFLMLQNTVNTYFNDDFLEAKNPETFSFDFDLFLDQEFKKEESFSPVYYLPMKIHNLWSSRFENINFQITIHRISNSNRFLLVDFIENLENNEFENLLRNICSKRAFLLNCDTNTNLELVISSFEGMNLSQKDIREFQTPMFIALSRNELQRTISNSLII